jgi:hypothetical protein
MKYPVISCAKIIKYPVISWVKVMKYPVIYWAKVMKCPVISWAKVMKYTVISSLSSPNIPPRRFRSQNKELMNTFGPKRKVKQDCRN